VNLATEKAGTKVAGEEALAASVLLHRIKQIVLALLLTGLLVVSATILRDYIRTQLFLWPAREEGASLALLFEPRFWVFRLPAQEGGRIAWHFATVGEPVEGSIGILRGPSWLLMLVALGSLATVTVLIADPELRRGKG
jgi:hypothetical protein